MMRKKNISNTKGANLTPEKGANLIEGGGVPPFLGESGGSDGTRTRGLWRDRPAL